MDKVPAILVIANIIDNNDAVVVSRASHTG